LSIVLFPSSVLFTRRCPPMPHIHFLSLHLRQVRPLFSSHVIFRRLPGLMDSLFSFSRLTSLGHPLQFQGFFFPFFRPPPIPARAPRPIPEFVPPHTFPIFTLTPDTTADLPFFFFYVCRFRFFFPLFPPRLLFLRILSSRLFLSHLFLPVDPFAPAFLCCRSGSSCCFHAHTHIPRQNLSLTPIDCPPWSR